MSREKPGAKHFKLLRIPAAGLEGETDMRRANRELL
jgi:hypothetical protein